MNALQLLTSFANLLALFMILSFLRKERLKEKYSLLWLLCIVIAQVLIIFYHWLDRVASWLGVFYPPSLIFFLAILFLFVMVLHLTLVLSKQNKQIQILAQRLALLQARIDRGETVQSATPLAKAAGSAPADSASGPERRPTPANPTTACGRNQTNHEPHEPHEQIRTR